MPGHPFPGGPGQRGAIVAAGQQLREKGASCRVSAAVSGSAVAVLVCLLTGCAARQSAESAGQNTPEAAAQAAAPASSGTPAAEVNKAPTPLVLMPDRIELSDLTLARALKALDDAPTSDAYRRVAIEYRRLKVYDQAHEYFTRAIKLDPKNAAAFDGLARTWRDWGLPRQGLSHAYMAVHLAPDWAAAQNTLGTMHYVLGNGVEARRRFERAIALDASAAYALNNLCYLSFTEGDDARAVAECTEALTRQPTLVAARNNLALVHAAAGRIDLSEREFLTAGSRGIGFYNLGIVHLARREYSRAVAAFETAFKEKPSLWEANVRAREARTLARPLGPDSIRN